MNRRISALLLTLLLMITGCAKVQVSQDYDIGTNFARFQTFDWKPMAEQSSTDIRVNNPLLHERFNQAISQVLGDMGYVRSAAADFVINYNYSIATRLESDPVCTSFGFGFGSHHRYGGIGVGTRADIRQYDVGILVIDIYDKASNALVWRGTGSEIVTTHSTPEKTTAMVYRMVRAILVQFPPP